MVKFTQIVASHVSPDAVHLFGLANDGTLWAGDIWHGSEKVIWRPLNLPEPFNAEGGLSAP